MSKLNEAQSSTNNQSIERLKSRAPFLLTHDNLKVKTLSEIALLSQEQALDLFFSKGA